MTKNLLFKTTFLVGLLTVILFFIFQHVHFSGSVLLNNLLWFVISLVLLFAVLKTNFKTVDDIIETVNKMADGDLTQKVSFKKNTSYKNLCTSINHFLLKVRKLINESATMTDKVIDHCEDLSENSNLAKIAANETYSVILEVSSDMMTQMDGTLQSEKLVHEIIDEHKEVAKNGNLIEDMAQTMINIVQESTEIYEELTSKLHESAASNNLLASKIANLNEKAFKIQSITDKVNEISRNTDLLSLNASIEAARSSEAGAGFAVVAGEIRQLSAISALQAKEIQSIIDDIRRDISDISLHMSKEVETIYKNVEFSNITKESLFKILDESQNTLTSIKGINQIIVKQNGKILDIKNTVEKIATISENTTSATQQVSASADEQLTAMQNVFNSISNLAEMNKDLKENIASFAQNYVVTSETQKYIDDGLKTLKELAQQKALPGMDYRICTEIIKENITHHPYFELLALMDKDGLRKAITLDYKEEEVYVNFSHRPYFKEAIQGKEYKSDPYISVDTNNYCIAISVPVKNSSDEIVGILMGDLILG